MSQPCWLVVDVAAVVAEVAADFRAVVAAVFHEEEAVAFRGVVMAEVAAAFRVAAMAAEIFLVAGEVTRVAA